MAVRMRRPDQEEETPQQKPQAKPASRYLVQPSQEPDTVPTNMVQSAPNQFQVNPADQQPQIHIHMSPTVMKSLPVYDDGGDVQAPFDPTQDLPGTSSMDEVAPIAQSVAGDASTPSLSFGGKVQNSLQKFAQGSNVDASDPSSMPGQTAQTRMYPVQGLDNRAPIMDDGGVVKKAASAGARMVAPDDDSAAGIAATNQNIQEYENATTPKQEPVQSHETSESDKVNPKAKYGDRPGEKRIDVSSYMKPLGSPRMAPIYDDGGPVKNDPNDGHHQLAVLEEGERVLTPEQNAQYEMQQGGAPADFGGPVLQQPNPPVRPMMDTEHVAEEPVGAAKMDTSNPPAANVEPAMMRPASNNVPAPKPAMAPVGQPKEQPKGPDITGQVIQDQALPEHNPMATTTSATPLPNEREKLESERAALKQKMVDAAEGKFNNGKFDHVAYGEAKMALADLNKAHPWGQPGNHEGFFGKLGHGLAQAGEIASDVVLGPAITERIPGTRENLNAQEAGGEQQIQSGLAGKASEAETALKTAQASMAGRPKDPKTGIAYETYNMQHSAPGTPEYENARANLAAYQEQDRQMNQNKQSAKPELLPQDVAAQTRKVLSLPEGSPERAQAEKDLKYMEAQAQNSKTLTDRHREINDYAIQHNLNPEDPDQYAQAVMGYESAKSGAKAEGSFPTWQKKAAIQDQLATRRALLVQQNADANTFGLEAAKLQQKSDQDYIKAIGHINLINKGLAASDASQVASNLVPLMGTLNVVHDVGGISRLNKQELDSLAPGHGSLTRWLAANWDRVAVGELPDDYQREISGLMKDLQANVNENHDSYTKSVDQNFRQHAQAPEVKNNPKGGTKVTPKATPPKNPTVPAGVPAGATHIYKDDKGNIKGYALNGQYHALTTK